MYRVNPRDTRTQQILFLGTFAVGLILLYIGYYKVQVSENNQFREIAQKNAVRVYDILPTRGDIFDRANQLIVDNRPAFSIYIYPFVYQKDSVARDRLLGLLNDSLTSRILLERLKFRKYNSVEKILVKRHISNELMASIVENKNQLIGVSVEIDPKRNRVADFNACHIMGFVKEITENQLKRYPQYKAGDVIGKDGLEGKYDLELFGTRGKKMVITDAHGNVVQEMQKEFGYEVAPEDGRDLHLTLDVKIQKLSEVLLNGHRGSVVALDVKTGGILAIASAPTYDPDILSRPISNQEWFNLSSKENYEPLLNRSVDGRYPPGSVYKMITLIAGLNEKLITPEWSVTCNGGYRIGNRTIHCWNLGGHGTVNAYSAISGSCNVYFFNLILKVGLERWVKYSSAFGFGRKTGIDLPSEMSGLLPDKAFYDSYNTYSLGKLLNLSIGQGELLTTPLQIAHYTSIIANKGVIYTPHFLKGTASKQHKKMTAINLTSQNLEVFVRPETWKVVHEAMVRCVNAPFNATGRGAKLEDFLVAGKTGTAQVPPKVSHAWFTCFAPANDPQIVVTVLLENAGGGGANAAPIAKLIMQQYFKGDVDIATLATPKMDKKLLDENPKHSIIPEFTLPPMNEIKFQREDDF